MEYEGLGWKGDGAAAVKYSAPVAVHSPADAYHTGSFGNWRGDFATSDGVMRIALHFWPAANTAVAGSIDSIDDDTYGLRIDSVKIEGNSLHFEIAGIGGVYDGKVSQKATSIEGTWTQHGNVMPLNLRRQ